MEQLYAALRLRNNVFVVEQEILFPDTDGKDQIAIHLLGYARDSLTGEIDMEELCVYCRIFAPGVYGTYEGASVGRVCGSLKYRRKGYGKVLMQKACEEIYSQFGNVKIEIGAQLYLKKFYEDVGFEHDGSPEYLDGDTIPHIHMIRRCQ